MYAFVLVVGTSLWTAHFTRLCLSPCAATHTDMKGGLDPERFVVAMYLTAACKDGAILPDVLPPDFESSVKACVSEGWARKVSIQVRVVVLNLGMPAPMCTVGCDMRPATHTTVDMLYVLTCPRTHAVVHALAVSHA